MADTPRRRLKRGVAVVLAVVVVAAVAIGVVAVVRSRQIERSVDAPLRSSSPPAQDLDQSLTTLDPATLDPQVTPSTKAKAVAPDDIKASVGTLADFVSELATRPSTRRRRTGPPPWPTPSTPRQDQIDSVTAAGKAGAAVGPGQLRPGPHRHRQHRRRRPAGSTSGSTTPTAPRNYV